MKKSIFLSVMALIISVGITAQTANRNRTQAEQNNPTQAQAQVRNQEQVMTKEQIKEQARFQKSIVKEEKKQAKMQRKIAKQEMKQARIEAKNGTSNHGTAVRETARNTESGPGKGEAVSSQAKNKSTIKQAKPASDGKAARTKAVKGTAVKTGKGRMAFGM